jgi:hypothetical protein
MLPVFVTTTYFAAPLFAFSGNAALVPVEAGATFVEITH